MTKRGVFIDEAILDISYVPDVILHRDAEFRALESLFDHMVATPYEMSRRPSY
jgi:Cdc6-like AAA superfamily ATPase